MGLCKCGRRKFTNLFCYEHRVNVCEHCIVSTHATCVVQSYLAWLHDENYDPNCSLCGELLSDPNSECIRLTCLHLYHWKCLDRWAGNFPATTAPAGYRCPTCQDPIFPKPNHVSPIVDKLKALLKNSNWARAGLGLPLMDTPPIDTPVVHQQQQAGGSADIDEMMLQKQKNGSIPVSLQQDATVEITSGPNNPVIGGSEYQGAASVRKSAAMACEGPGSTEVIGVRGMEQDMDLSENKYKRRTALEWLRRFLRSRGTYPAMSDPLRGYKRLFLILLLVIMGIMTVIMVLTSVSKSRSDSDPFLDPMGNPNLRAAAGAGPAADSDEKHLLY